MANSQSCSDQILHFKQVIQCWILSLSELHTNRFWAEVEEDKSERRKCKFYHFKKKKYVYFYSSRYLKLKQTFQNTVLGVITLSVKDYRLQEDAFLFKQRGAMSWTWTFSEFGSRVQIAGRRETALQCCRYRVKKRLHKNLQDHVLNISSHVSIWTPTLQRTQTH